MYGTGLCAGVAALARLIITVSACMLRRKSKVKQFFKNQMQHPTSGQLCVAMAALERLIVTAQEKLRQLGGTGSSHRMI